MTTPELNGAALPPQDVTELILSNGLRAWVHPVTQHDERALILGWQRDNPMPDKKQFEKPVDPEFASQEGQVIPAEENPDYHALMLQRRSELNSHMTSAYLLGFIEFPDHNDDELIAHYATIIKRKRAIMDIPEDPWQATLLFAILETDDDQRNIIRAVERKLPVELEEIADAVRIFRPHTGKRTNGKVPDGRIETQGAEVETGTQ